jgi:hypothetical protein
MTNRPQPHRLGRLTKSSIVALAVAVLTVVPASAVLDNEDLVTVGRMGPIERDETTLGQVKGWFGQPASVSRHQYQCITVIDAVWPGRFRILFHETEKTVVVAKLRKRSVVSDRHGLLQFHTRKGLRVGDSAGRVDDLYPRAGRHHHPNKNHWILVSNLRGRLEATTSGHEVTELRVFPYEAC